MNFRTIFSESRLVVSLGGRGGFLVALFVGVVMVAIADGLGGCAAIGRAIVEKPKIELDHIALDDVSLTGATALVALEVKNPNAFSLKVDALKYEVEIGGKQVGQGKIDHAIEVAGKKTEIVEIPVPFKYGKLFSSLLALVKDKTTQYRVKGEASVGPMVIPFDKTGDLKLE